MRKQEAEDRKRRQNAQARIKTLKEQPIQLPTGFINRQEALEYLMRRYGPAAPTETLNKFIDPITGPKPYRLGDGDIYYRYDDIDLWMYRTLTGVPASYIEVRNRVSSVPIRKIQLEDLRDGR